jgi:uncharacterized protein YabN with tetrapyrrole methylase and pyrophosphatase domain
LTIVGTGIKAVGQITLEAAATIRNAERVLYLAADTITEAWILEQNPNSESLQGCYADSKLRMQSYLEMIERILTYVRSGMDVCAAFYGHPGVFVYPSHEAIRIARAEGFPATMLPGVSAEDCLFADLGFDPARHGCQSFEATDFLLYGRQFDPRCSLILWQVGLVGEIDFKRRYKASGLRLVVERLLASYPASHEVAIYEAAQYTICEPRVDWMPLGKLIESRVTPISTLYVPRLSDAVADASLARRLHDAVNF